MEWQIAPHIPGTGLADPQRVCPAPAPGAAGSRSFPGAGQLRSVAARRSHRRPPEPLRWLLSQFPAAGEREPCRDSGRSWPCAVTLSSGAGDRANGRAAGLWSRPAALANSSRLVTRDKLLAEARAVSQPPFPEPAAAIEDAAPEGRGRSDDPGSRSSPRGSRPHPPLWPRGRPPQSLPEAPGLPSAGDRPAGRRRSRPLVDRGGAGRAAVTWVPFSRPAGHRQSVEEQEPRAQPARARPSARRHPGLAGAAGGEAAGRTHAATATPAAWSRAREASGGGRCRRNPGRIFWLGGRALHSLSQQRQTPSGARVRARGPGRSPRGLRAARVRTCATVATLGSWFSAWLLPRLFSQPEAQARVPPSPPGSGPARTQHHEETWDLPGDFGRTFVNCGWGNVLR
jgi:hypothetical protein